MKYKVADATNQKLRGGYYTPQELADFLASWGIQSTSEEVLEPSCGDGALLTAAAKRLITLGADPTNIGRQIQGVELYSSEALLACESLERLGISGSNSVTVGDFFEYDDQEWGVIGKKFDVVIGNPPFLRFQNFPEDQRIRAFRVMQTAGLKPSRLTNSWLAFLVASSLRLKPKGRLAMVIPAELLQVKYAEETRAFLARNFSTITIISFRRLVFEGVLQEVVLLLAEKDSDSGEGIHIVELGDANDLRNYTVQICDKNVLKHLDHAREKWTQYYLDKSEVHLLRELEAHPELKRFKDIGSVDVGVVTGNNDFFVLNREEVEEYHLHDFVVPLAARTAQLTGLDFQYSIWEEQQRAGVSCYLLNLPGANYALLPDAVKEYISLGERAGVHLGYKCSIRKPWYTTPSLWMPDAFLFRQIYAYPKLVHNGAVATSTDTIHRVRFYNKEHTRLATASYLNSLSFAFSEVFGRSYGGGVLELEPTEAENLPIPFFEDAELPFASINTLEKSRDINRVLELVDTELLVGRLNLAWSDVMKLRGIWGKLSQRRLGRSGKKTRAKGGAANGQAS